MGDQMNLIGGLREVYHPRSGKEPPNLRRDTPYSRNFESRQELVPANSRLREYRT
jgi:hypothetical protein